VFNLSIALSGSAVSGRLQGSPDVLLALRAYIGLTEVDHFGGVRRELLEDIAGGIVELAVGHQLGEA
jgi:hypothetical protein